MPKKHPPKKAKGAPQAAAKPQGPDDIFEAVEESLERGERKLRDREPAKAQALFQAAVQQLQGAGLALLPRGSVLLASLTGSLLSLDAEAARHAAWARRGAAPAPDPPPLTSAQRHAALQAAATALEAGQAAAEAARAPPEELSLMHDSAAQLATCLSEEYESEADGVTAARPAAGPAARGGGMV